MHGLLLTARSNFDREYRHAKRQHLKEKQAKISKLRTDNPRSFWDIIQQLGPEKKKDSIPNEVIINGEVINSLDAVLQHWQEEFRNLFSEQNSDTFDDQFYLNAQQMLHEWEEHYAELLIYNGNGFGPGNHINDNLNLPISLEEIKKMLKRMKNGRAVGTDNMPNEILKHPNVLQLLLSLYSKCFETGLIPDVWKMSIINPIRKPGKEPRIPTNNRAISLISTVAKGYSQILNERITGYLEANGVMSDAQNGFRKLRSAIDHLYTLLQVLGERKRQNKDTFVCYVDFTRAFDLIPHDLLKLKLLQHGIDGKIYQSICSIYTNMKSCIKLNGHYTDYFDVCTGTRQGDNLSPTIFGLYVNDLLKNVQNLDLGVLHGESKISVLAYADDIALIAETERDLQTMMDTLRDYCSKWRLLVNSNKTQVMHFRKVNKQETNFEFKYGEERILTTNSYRYLGLQLNFNLDIGKMVDVLVNASGRALAKVTSKFYEIDGLDYKSFKTLYDSLVQPVMNYASATWGHSSFQKCSTIQNRAMRTILGVGRVTPVGALYGDLGWSPPSIKHKLEIVKYWLRLSRMPENRMIKKVFNHDYKQSNKGRISSGHAIKLLFENAGLSTWDNLNSDGFSDAFILKQIEQSEMQIYQETLQNEMKEMSRLTIYNQIKSDFKLEQYVEHIQNRKQRGILARARMGVLPIHIETGRYCGKPRDERLCYFCDEQVVEDEAHLLLHCNKYEDIRNEFYRTVLANINCELLTDTELLCFILANDDTTIMSLSSKFIQKILMRRSAS